MNKDILQRYVEGNVTSEEVEAVVDWLDADEKHVKELMSLHKLYNISVLNQPVLLQEKTGTSRLTLLRRIINEVVKVAAIVLVVLGIEFLLEKEELTEVAPLFQTLYVPSGQRAELILPDSTKVWVNAHSRIVYPVTFHKNYRQVELDGEAYFDVKHDETSPFIVKTEKMDVKVLGTEFNVSAYSKNPEFKVALLKGSVELESSKSSLKYRMKPGEQIRLKEGKYISSDIKDMDYFKWKEGLLCFNNQPISEIMDELSLYFDIEISITDRSFLKQRYSGKFRIKDGIEHVLKVLQLEHRFTYVKDNELNKITIK